MLSDLLFYKMETLILHLTVKKSFVHLVKKIHLLLTTKISDYFQDTLVKKGKLHLVELQVSQKRNKKNYLKLLKERDFSL